MDALKLSKAKTTNAPSSSSSTAAANSVQAGGQASTTTSSVSSSSPATTAAASAATAITTQQTPTAAGKTSIGSAITVRFNAGDDTLDDILESFHKNTSGGSTSNNNNSNISPISGGGGSTGSGSGACLGLGNSEQQQVSLSHSPTNKSPQSNSSGGLASSGSGTGADSLSSSPSQYQNQQPTALFGNDEVVIRNNFLQGGFFNRKRSGSIEGVSPTASGPNLIAALASGASGEHSTSSGSSGGVGTWRLIKGKVSQTIEEIKSSKSHTTNIPIVVAKAPTTDQSSSTLHEGDSDPENIAMNTSASDDLSLEHDMKPRGSAGGGGSNSESDIENELQMDSNTNTAVDGSERSRLRRGLAHIRSKVKAKSTSSQLQSLNTLSTAAPAASVPGSNSTILSFSGRSSKDTSPSASVERHTLRGNFLRKRNRKQEVEQAELATPSAPPEQPTPEIHVLSAKSKRRGIINAKKDVEIESGVEMLEDMLIPTTAPLTETDSAATFPTGSYELMAKRPSLELKLENLNTQLNVSVKSRTGGLAQARNLVTRSVSVTLDGAFKFGSIKPEYMELVMRFLPLALMLGFLIIMLLPMHDFIRGILATLLFIMLVETGGTYLHQLWERVLIKHPPEKAKFKVPDYSKMPICEIPAVEEHKTIKTYSGWLNELNSYDPNSFSFTLTRSVYVRLDGSVLKLSGTNARIPKRVMWNESPIDKSRIIFTDHRTYNLFGCRVELLPLGLAKKRYFNRKYPIQLIIKLNADSARQSPSKEDELPKLEAKEAKISLISNQGSNELSSVEDKDANTTRQEKQIDFAATVLNADLQKLQGFVNSDAELKDLSMPCGDEVRLLLFTRGDREKEDWYRRFVAASKGIVHDQDLRLPNVRFVEDADLQAAATKAALQLTNANVKKRSSKDYEERASMLSEDSQSLDVKADKSGTTNVGAPEEGETPDLQFEDLAADEDLQELQQQDDTFQGLLMTTCAARNPAGYIRFMAMYQNACNQNKIPICKRKKPQTHHHHHRRKQRRAQRQEDELWKGIDQSLFLGPSGSVVWANVLFGRCMYSCLHDNVLQGKIQEFLQKKLNSIKLPNFMESVNITQIHLGQTPILIHRISQPMLDERGTWLDADITYEGLAHITVTTKLNLLRMKRPKTSHIVQEVAMGTPFVPDTFEGTIASTISEDTIVDPLTSAIYDSDAESSGSSSTESESPLPGVASDASGTNDFFQNSPGNARRIFKIVDRIATSNFFQYAAELPYVQRAMENMSANITLRVDLKGLVARATLNMPPPPSDRIWMCFRGPPRLWIRAKPTVGDKSVDWSIVTNVIESKLCEAVNKYLVYPNMVDFTIPFLGKPTCEEFTTTTNTSNTNNPMSTTNNTNNATTTATTATTNTTTTTNPGNANTT